MLVYRICAGRRLIMGGRIEFRSPSMFERYLAELEYKEEFLESSVSGAISQEEALIRAIEENLWSQEMAKELEGLEKDLEELKVRLCGLHFKPEEWKIVKKMIEKAKDRRNQLYMAQNAYEHLTREYIAAGAKHSYLVASSCFRDGVSIKDELLSDGFLLQSVIGELNFDSIGENEYRELARTEPWRLYWILGKEQGIFGKPSTEFTDEQRMLCFWSKLYDSVYESVDMPTDDIIEDDDALDGWFILQKRKRDKDRGQSEADKLASKHGNAQEVFVVTDSIEGAKKIAALNDATSEALRKQRMKLVQSRGEINELEMPDTKQRLLLEAQNKFREQVKGKR